MKKGSIWLARLPIGDGREQHGDRPVLVFSEAIANTVMVIPLTTNLQALRFESTIMLEPSKQNGLASVSIALVFQLRAMDTDRLISNIGAVDTEKMRQINTAIKRLLELK